MIRNILKMHYNSPKINVFLSKLIFKDTRLSQPQLHRKIPIAPLVWLRSPIDRHFPLAFKIFISPAERATPEKAPICRKWRRMGRLDDKMPGGIDHLPFSLGIGSPKDKNYAFLFPGDQFYDVICKLFPTFILVRTCRISPYGQCCV